ncbi:MAG TPA: ribonuclease P protein component [Polyangiaceae bacterium]
MTGSPLRVRKRSEYLVIQRDGRRASTPAFAFLLRARADESGPALGITASRRIGNAVTRNRAKRLVREAFRATPELWDRRLDVVVVVKRPLAGYKLGDVVTEWRAAVRTISRQGTAALADRERREASTESRVANGD